MMPHLCHPGGQRCFFAGIAAACVPTDSVTADSSPRPWRAVRKFVTDKDYQGALDELKKLSDLKLSAGQQQTVDDLKS